MDAPAGVLWLWAPAPLSSSASAARESVQTTTGPAACSPDRPATHSSAAFRANSSARVLLQY